jgi:tRNA dimethylallyltransferase
MLNKNKYLIVIAGPTAIGKTQLAIRLAHYFNTEIVSADSRQIYKELTIGTAKPTPEEQKQIKHHLIDFISINQEYTVGDYEKQALTLLNELFKKHQLVVLAGGTGLYINALLNGMDSLPPKDNKIRTWLTDLHKTQGLQALQDLLLQKDPVYYKQVDLKNPHRLIRALEVSLITQQPYSTFRTGKTHKRMFTPIKIALEIDREILYQRINARVDAMIKQGLVSEAKQLFPYKHLNALKTVGYTELFDYLDGRITLTHAIELIKQHTRNYAKRQLTWFRKDNDYKRFNPENYNEILNYILNSMHA